MQKSKTNAHLKNSLSGGVQLIISAVLMASGVWVFMGSLGPVAYGAFSLVTVIGNLNVFSSLGLNAALIRFLSEQGKGVESSHDIVVNLLVLAAISIPITVAGVMFRRFILISVLGVPSSMADETGDLLACLLLSNLLLLLGQPFSAILDSLQRIYLSNVLQLIYNISYWGFLILGLLLGGTLRMLGLFILLAAMIWLGLSIMFSVRAWGKIVMAGLCKNIFRLAKKQLGYGFQVYAANCIGFLYEPLTKVLLSHFIGIAEVGFLDIALKIRNQLWGAVNRLLYPFFPYVAQMNDKAHISTLVEDVEEKTVLLVVPLTALVVCLAEPLVSVWIGHNVHVISISSAIIVSAHLLFSNTITPYYQYLVAKGHASKTIVLQLANVMGNAFIFLVSFSWLGYYAVVVANVAAIASSFSLGLAFQRKDLAISLRAWFRRAGKPVAVMGIDIVVGYVLSLLIVGEMWQLTLFPFVIGAMTIGLYRQMRLVLPEDIPRYVGEYPRLQSLLLRVLCKA